MKSHHPTWSPSLPPAGAGVCAPLPPLGRRCARPYPGRRRARPLTTVSTQCAPMHTVVNDMSASGDLASILFTASRTRYIKGICPSYPHFTTLGFVSWDSFVGSLHEVAGMVFQSLIQLTLDFFP
jgi:hypothetical protein